MVGSLEKVTCSLLSGFQTNNIVFVFSFVRLIHIGRCGKVARYRKILLSPWKAASFGAAEKGARRAMAYMMSGRVQMV